MAKLKVNVPVPVFWTYTVWMAELPAATDPQFMVVMLVVHALSEKTPRLGEVVIVPDEGMFLLGFKVASVSAVSADATTTSAMTNTIGLEIGIGGFTFLFKKERCIET